MRGGVAYDIGVGMLLRGARGHGTTLIRKESRWFTSM
jgi:hypothetical protein